LALNAYTDSPLSPRERVGVRAFLAIKPHAEKAAPFSTLRIYDYGISL